MVWNGVNKVKDDIGHELTKKLSGYGYNSLNFYPTGPSKDFLERSL